MTPFPGLGRRAEFRRNSRRWEKAGGGGEADETRHGLTGGPFVFYGELFGPFSTLSANPSIGIWAGAEVPGTRIGFEAGAYVNIADAWDCGGAR